LTDVRVPALVRLAVSVLPLVLPLVSVARAAPPDDDPYGDVIDEFRRRVRRGSVERASAAIGTLDAQNPRSLPELVDVLSSGHWFVRGTAIDALAGIPAGPLRSELRLHLLTHEDPWVREGVAYAMAAAHIAFWTL